MNHAINL